MIFINTFCKENQAINHPIYAIYHDFGCFTLATNDLPNHKITIQETINTPQIVNIGDVL